MRAKPLSRVHCCDLDHIANAAFFAISLRLFAGLGTDDKSIGTVDADGVALAAIQGLNEKVEVRSERAEVRTRELEQPNNGLNRRTQDTEIAELKQRLETLGQIIHNQNQNRGTHP